MKCELTQQDQEYLSAARGLDLTRDAGPRRYANFSGLKPSVTTYNKAIKLGIYYGFPITPIDTSEG